METMQPTLGLVHLYATIIHKQQNKQTNKQKQFEVHELRIDLLIKKGNVTTHVDHNPLDDPLPFKIAV